MNRQGDFLDMIDTHMSAEVAEKLYDVMGGALRDLVIRYWASRGRRWPNEVEALAWAATEVGEALDIALQRQGGWVRHNPDDHDDISDEALAEELADIIVMIVVCGIAAGVCPIAAVWRKFNVVGQR